MFRKKNRLFQRLQTLDKYFTVTEFKDSMIDIIENTMLEDESHCTHFKFYSNQGQVEIVLFRNNTFGTYEISYTNYAGVKMFEIESTESENTVSPCMGYDYNVSAKDIDLAILELEEFLKNTYGDVEDKWEQYQTITEVAWESHRQQLKELY